MKDFLSSENIKYHFVDINKSLANLLAFLRYRDSSEEFTEIKNAGRIGIPCVIVNDGEQIVFNKDDLNVEKLRIE